MGGLMPRILVAVLAAYLLGNLNGAVTVSSLLDRDDVRTHGSGNAGMTNYMRSYGLRKTGLVILLDLGKALLASYLGALLLEPYGYFMEGAMLAGVLVSVGHDYPVVLGFRGGKGILCGLGVAFVADWRIALLVLGIFGITVLLTRYVSLGSCLAAVALGISFWALHGDRPWVVAAAVVIAVLAIFMHRSNLRRLCHGTERKASFRRKGERT